MTTSSAAQDTCSGCGQPLVPIAYGYPGPEMWEAAERGEIVLGGCMISPGQPKSRCPACASEDDGSDVRGSQD